MLYIQKQGKNSPYPELYAVIYEAKNFIRVVARDQNKTQAEYIISSINRLYK